MSKKPKTISVEQLVLVQHPILGSKYELQMVEVEVTLQDGTSEELLKNHGIDVVAELTETLTKELKKATKKATKKAPKNEQ
jgi:post-segregation antitoxin (ccd killing protein)